jgi:hypothetical protein
LREASIVLKSRNIVNLQNHRGYMVDRHKLTNRNVHVPVDGIDAASAGERKASRWNSSRRSCGGLGADGPDIFE